VVTVGGGGWGACLLTQIEGRSSEAPHMYLHYFQCLIHEVKRCIDCNERYIYVVLISVALIVPLQNPFWPFKMKKNFLLYGTVSVSLDIGNPIQVYLRT
jgi:hypothetical protein